MKRDVDHKNGSSYIKPIVWCNYIVKTAYATAAFITLAHVIWYFAARDVLAWPSDVYLQNYIIFPAIGSFTLTISVDLFVRSPRIPLNAKEYLSLSLFVVFSFYLALTHAIASVLLASFILPIFASTIFFKIRITRWMFGVSSFALLLLGAKGYVSGELNSGVLMQLFVSWFMFLCTYLLAKIFIRYGHDNLSALTIFDSRQQLMEEQLKLDPFTGLYNRRTYDELLPKLFEECRIAGTSVSLAMIDVDHFKTVNDLYGHAAGDRVLLYLSQILEEFQTDCILAFRIGGDEFALLFKDCSMQEAYRICENVRVRMMVCPLRAKDEKRITASFGLACINPSGVSPEFLAQAADSALYAAKSSGRNQIAIYGEELPV